MKWLFRIIIIVIVAFGLQYTPITFSDDFCFVVYTVIGIMFPLALNQKMTFAFIEIPNDKFVKEQRNRLAKIMYSYIVLFAIATAVLLLKSLALNFEWEWIKFDFKFFIGSYFIFTLIYFIGNFISLAKLKDQIDDEIRKLKYSKNED
jgi:hypothetical protein